MSASFRVGTRRSPLARAQAESVVARLIRTVPAARFEVVPLDASGDRDLTPGSSPDFTDALDRALLRGELDLAVHSAKDLPAELDPELAIVACPRRADPRDCLVANTPRPAASLPRGARIGSSSLRRRAQLLRWRPDLAVVEVRGNVDSRIRQVRSGALDAVMLAVAGVSRLGRAKEIGHIFPAASFVPAPAQGALAVVARASDSAAASVAHRVDDGGTHTAVVAERAFAAALGGDCRLPLGALATLRGETVSLVGEVLSPDGRRSLRKRRHAPASEAAAVGSILGEEMRRGGALDLMDSTGRMAQ